MAGSKHGDKHEDLMYKIRLCAQTEQADMALQACDTVAKEIKDGDALTTNDYEAICSVLKTAMGKRRLSLHKLNTRKKFELELGNRGKYAIIEEYAKTPFRELQDIIALADSITAAVVSNEGVNKEDKLLMQKLKADAKRYLIDFAPSSETEGLKADARKLYVEIYEDCKKLPTTSLVRLGIILNYSIFLYEVAGDHNQAITLAENTVREMDPNPNSEHQMYYEYFKVNLAAWHSTY